MNSEHTPNQEQRWEVRLGLLVTMTIEAASASDAEVMSYHALQLAADVPYELDTITCVGVVKAKD